MTQLGEQSIQTVDVGYRKYEGKPHGFSRGMTPTTGTHPTPREQAASLAYTNHKLYAYEQLRRTQTGAGGGEPLGVRLTSGTLNVNGEYDSPANDTAKTGVHAESHPFTGG
jgi:hypothetical protein